MIDFRKYQGIYGIQNIITKKIYIGSTINLYNRWSVHISDLKLEKHYNTKLQEDFNTYGEKNFKVIQLEEVWLEEFLLERENYWIFYYKDNCYNTFNADHSTIVDEQFRKNCSERFKSENNPMRKYNIDFSGEKNPHYGKKHSEETLKLLSSLKKGENNPVYGKIRVNDGKKVWTIFPEEFDASHMIKGQLKRLWVNNGVVERLIKVIEVDIFLENGYCKGRLSKN